MPVTFTLPALPPYLFELLAWSLAGLLVFLYLRRDLTPAKVLSIFETDGTLSARQILAWIVAIFGMAMRAAGRLDNEGMKYCFECSFILFGIGGLVKAADKVKGPAVVNAKKADVNVAGDANITESANQPDGPAPRI